MEKILKNVFTDYIDFDEITTMVCDATDSSQAELIIRAYCMAEYMMILQQANSDKGDMRLALYGFGCPTDNSYVKKALMESLTGLDFWEAHRESIYSQFCEKNPDLAQHFFWIQARYYMALEGFVEQEKVDGQAFLASFHEKEALNKSLAFLREIASKYVSVSDVMEAHAEAEEELDYSWIENIDKILCGVHLQ